MSTNLLPPNDEDRSAQLMHVQYITIIYYYHLWEKTIYQIPRRGKNILLPPKLLLCTFSLIIPYNRVVYVQNFLVSHQIKQYCLGDTNLLGH